jgi:membrane protease YdiL (CAAX protease family)
MDSEKMRSQMGNRSVVPKPLHMTIKCFEVAILWLSIEVANHILFFDTHRELYNVLVIVGYLIGVLFLFALLGTKKFDIRSTLKLRLIDKTIFSVMVIITLGMILLTSGLAEILSSFIPYRSMMEAYLRNRPQSPIGYVLFLLSTSLAAPLLEELIFRGLMQSSLYSRYGLWRSIVIPSIIFGIIHVFPIAMIITMISALLYGYVVHRTKSVFSSLVMHSLNNAFVSIYTIIVYTEIPADIKVDYWGIAFIISGTIVILIGFQFLKKVMCEREVEKM